MKRAILALLLVAAYPASAATTGQTTIVAPSVSGSDDQTAAEVPITDAGGFFTGTEVESALQEIGPTMTDARTPTSHVHAASDTTTGIFTTPRLGSGTADATTFLRGDQTWAAPPSSNHTRVLTVDSGGLGDYTTVKAAVDFATSQTPTQTTPWLIQVTPGWYLEDPFTVPIHVHVQGMMTRGPSDTHVVGETFIYTDDTTGDFITLAAGSMSYVSIVSITDATGVMTLVASTANGSYLHASSIYTLSASTAAPVRLLESRSGTLLADTIVLQTMDPASTQTDFIRLIGAAHVSVRNSWLMCNGLSPRSAVYQESTGHAVFYDVRIGTFTGSTFGTDFANINGGTLAVSHDTGYKTATGTLPFDPWGKWYATERGEREAPSATDTPLTIKGAASQTADLSRWLDSSDTEIASVDAAGTWTGGLSPDSVGLAELAACTGPDEIVEYGASGVPTCIETPAGGGGGSFTDLTSGTNTTAAMIAGSGSSLKIAGTGTIDASGIDADGDGTRELTCTPGSTICAIAPAENTIDFRFQSYGGGSPWFQLYDGGNRAGIRSYSGLARATYGDNEYWGWGVGSIRSLDSAGFSIFTAPPTATSPNFVPNVSDPDVGLCYGGSDDLRLCAGGVSGLSVTAGDVISLLPIAYNPGTTTCADSGDGSPGFLVIAPTTSSVRPTNSDANGCTASLSEVGAVNGQQLRITLVSSAGGTLDFADSAGVQETGAGCSLSIYGVANFEYITDRWVLTGCVATN